MTYHFSGLVVVVEFLLEQAYYRAYSHHQAEYGKPRKVCRGLASASTADETFEAVVTVDDS